MVNQGIVYGENQACVGQMTLRFLPGLTGVRPEGVGPAYPYVAIVRESSHPKDLKVGAAYLCEEQGKFKFLKNVDLSLTDIQLEEQFLVPSIENDTPSQK